MASGRELTDLAPQYQSSGYWTFTKQRGASCGLSLLRQCQHCRKSGFCPVLRSLRRPAGDQFLADCSGSERQGLRLQAACRAGAWLLRLTRGVSEPSGYESACARYSLRQLPIAAATAMPDGLFGGLPGSRLLPCAFARAAQPLCCRSLLLSSTFTRFSGAKRSERVDCRKLIPASLNFF